jgi:integrase
MKGHICRRSKGSWTIVINLGKDGNGRRKQKWLTVRGKKSAAQKELRRILHQLDTGSFVDPGNTTVAEYLAHWLETTAKHKVSRNTFSRYSAIVHSHLKPAIGQHALLKLRPGHIQAYYAEALSSGRKGGTKGLSPTSVLQHHRVLRQALKKAVRERLLVWNPTDAVDPPRRAHHEMPTLDEDQTLQLLKAAASSRVSIPVLLALTTGMRRGEILALRWKDVDLDAKSLSVQRTLEQAGSSLSFKQPKTRKARRVVALPKIAVRVLRQHRSRQSEHKLLLGKAYEDNDLICPRPDGRPYAPNSFSSTFRKMLRQTTLPPIRFHDLRHTHATLLLRQGIHPKVVSERLGHSTIGITLDIYSHVLPGMQEEAAARLDSVFTRHE